LLLKLKAFMHFCFSWTRTISRRGRSDPYPSMSRGNFSGGFSKSVFNYQVVNITYNWLNYVFFFN
jgi:hypothetical protein